MRCIGLYVHKKNTTACVIAVGGKIVKTIETLFTTDGLTAIRNCTENDDYHVMMESSTYAYYVYRYFDDICIEVHAVQPNR